MRAVAFLTLAAVAVSACEPAAKSDAAAVERAWIRLAAVPDRPSAAYFTLKGGAGDDSLAGIESDKVQRIELHEGGMSGGMMTMRPLASVPLAAGKTVAFAPGADHAMLFGVDPGARPGTTLPLRFRLGSGAVIRAEARIVGAGDPPPADGG